MPTATTITRVVLPSLLVSGLLGLAPALAAQSTEQHKLLPDDGLAGDEFGAAVATDGARVAVGAPNADHSGTTSGSAYVFEAQSGAQLLELVPANGAPGDKLGAAIATDGTRVVVGAPTADRVGLDSGSAYVFDATTGLELLELAPSDATAGDQFGYSVALDDGLVVVGALGAAYLFDASTGQQLDKLLPIGGSTTLGLSGFGEVVDIDAGLIVVGARLENGVSGIAGAAYVYDAASGDQLHRLIAQNGTAWAYFGACVSIDGSVIGIGAPEAGPKGKHSGAAYVFDASSGQQVHYVFPSDGHVFAKFGSSVAVDGEDVYFGSEQSNAGGLFSSGSVYLYDAQSGSQLDTLVASDAAPNDELGGALAVAGGVLVSGAARDDDLGTSSGAAYVFDLDSGWSSLGSALPGTNGAPALVGTGAVTANAPFTLALTGALENGTAYLVVGLAELSAPFKGGTLVPDITPPGFVIALPTGPFGAITINATWPSGLPSGLSTYFQYWIVDPAGPVGFSASNGLSGTAQ